MQFIFGIKQPSVGMLICSVCGDEFKKNPGRASKYCESCRPLPASHTILHGEILRCFLSKPGNAIVCNNSGTLAVYAGGDSFQMDTFDEVMDVVKARV